MQFIDLKTQYQKIKPKIQERVNAVLEHGQYILGPEVDELESKLQKFVQVKHAIAVANGTDALMLAMMALDIGPGDEVITSPFSFIAAAEVVEFLGAKCVFVDIDPKTFNLNPKLLEEKITQRTKAIVPVDLYGQCADYDVICNIANSYNIPVIQDAAQSFGAIYKDRKACSLGDMSCTSFFPAKSLGAYGDAGAVFTNDDSLARKLREIRNHGQERRYYHTRIGVNSRLDSIQAAILICKLEIFEEETKLRLEVAKRYDTLLSNYVVTPFIEEFNQSIYAQYTIRLENRDEVAKKLNEKGIPTSIHYPLPIHKQPVFSTTYGKETYVHSEEVARTVLSLPMHPYLSTADQERICHELISLVKKTSPKARPSAGVPADLA